MTTQKATTEKDKKEEPQVRQWYFMARDFEETTECLGRNGESIAESEARLYLFTGTDQEAGIEANRRADLWESRKDCFAAQVTHVSLGKVLTENDVTPLTELEKAKEEYQRLWNLEQQSRELNPPYAETSKPEGEKKS